MSLVILPKTPMSRSSIATTFKLSFRFSTKYQLPLWPLIT
jgi:hypothetical protein